MCIEVVLISLLCSEIVDTKQLHNISINDNNFLAPFAELKNNIFDLYGMREDEYEVYWRYSNKTFFQISDYFSYLAATQLTGENKIYLLMHDYTESKFIDNGRYLEVLDLIADRIEMEKKRDIYDVQIDREIEGEEEQMLFEAENDTTPYRTKSDIIKFALRHCPASPFFTKHAQQNYNLINNIKKGYSTTKTKFIRPAEEIIERVGVGAGKNKKTNKENDKKTNKKKKK